MAEDTVFGGGLEINLDLSWVGKTAPDGDYLMVVKHASLKKSKKGNLMYFVATKISEGECAGIPVLFNIMLQGGFEEFAAAAFNAILGYVPGGPGVVLDLAALQAIAKELMGKQFWAHLGTDIVNNEPKNVVTGFLNL